MDNTSPSLQPTLTSQCRPLTNMVNMHNSIGCKNAVGAAKSRSTSAGSSAECSCGEKSEAHTSAPSTSTEDVQQLPDLIYPTTFTFNCFPDVSGNESSSFVYIKNTFIETEVWRPSSFNGFCEVRQTQSCPASMIKAVTGLEEEANDTSTLLRRSITTGSETFANASVLWAEPSNNTMSASTNMPKWQLTIPVSSPAVGSGRGDFEDPFDALPVYHKIENGLPEYDYPLLTNMKQVPKFPEINEMPVYNIKNTFVDTDTCLSSTNSCYKARQVQSCPASGIGGFYDLEDRTHETGRLTSTTNSFTISSFAEASKLRAAPIDVMREEESTCCKTNEVRSCTGAQWPPSMTPPPPKSPVLPPTLEQAVPIYPPPGPIGCSQEEYSYFVCRFEHLPESSFSATMPQPPALPPRGQAHTLRLFEALSEPILGSPELPTIGSAAHYCGKCKPCAHVEKKGCQNGIQCRFCHLCPPGELRRRHQQKKQRGLETQAAGTRRSKFE